MRILDLFRKLPEQRVTLSIPFGAMALISGIVLAGALLFGCGRITRADGLPHPLLKTLGPDATANAALSFPHDTEAEALCVRVEAALVAHQYKVLDATEAALKDPEVRLVGGNSQLYHYYAALGATSQAGLFQCRSPFGHHRKLQLLESWNAAEPASVAAHIALAQFWTNAAWVARGDNFLNRLTQPLWNLLDDDLKNAGAALAGIDEGTDPHGYFVRMEILRGTSNPRAELDRVYGLAIKKYPGYFHYYSQRANVLQIRWYGEQGELQGYNASVLRSPGGDAGLVAFSYVAYVLMQNNARPTLLQATGLSWPVVKRAYATRERLYGLRSRDWNALLNLSLAAVDRESAKAALEKVDGHWDPAVWKERRYFDEAVEWTSRQKH